MLDWPDYDPETYETETLQTEVGTWQRALQAAFVDSTAGTSSSIKSRVNLLLDRLRDIETYHDWKRQYRTILEEFIDIQASVSPDQCLDMAQAGLDALHDTLLFRLDQHTIVPAKDAFLITSSFTKLETATVLGNRAPDIDFQFGLANPRSPGSQNTLYGMEAIAQIDAWYNYGIMETSASVLAKQTFQYHGSAIPTMLGATGTTTTGSSNKRFVVLGCTSELGPTRSLLQIPGVTVLGIARGGPKLDALLNFVKCHSPDDTTFVYNPHGADILTQGPQISQWILDQTSVNDELIILPLAQYCPLEQTHEGYEVDEQGAAAVTVRLKVAMDLIIQRVFRQRPNNSTICQYLSPTSIMMVPPTATTKAMQRLEHRPKWEQFVTKWSSQWLQPSWMRTTGNDNTPTKENYDYCLINGCMSNQGPLHVLAQTIQQWRAMIAYYRDAHVVTSPYAPLCWTQGNSRKLKRTLEGMHHFEPMIAMEASCASTLMAAILVSQIQFLNRPLPDMDENPFTMFWDGSVHGGVWTCPYSLESLSTVNWVMGITGVNSTGGSGGSTGNNMNNSDGDKADGGNNNMDGNQQHYTPPESIALSQEELAKIPVRDPEEVLAEMAMSHTQDLPDYVRERLDFM